MKTLQCDCPRDTEDGEDCPGVVTVELEYEPPDNNWGADRDGNRGIRVAGYWSASPANACSLGHVLTFDEVMEIHDEAQREAGADVKAGYYGPDGPED